MMISLLPQLQLFLRNGLVTRDSMTGIMGNQQKKVSPYFFLHPIWCISILVGVVNFFNSKGFESIKRHYEKMSAPIFSASNLVYFHFSGWNHGQPAQKV